MKDIQEFINNINDEMKNNKPKIDNSLLFEDVYLNEFTTPGIVFDLNKQNKNQIGGSHEEFLKLNNNNKLTTLDNEIYDSYKSKIKTVLKKIISKRSLQNDVNEFVIRNYINNKFIDKYIYTNIYNNSRSNNIDYSQFMINKYYKNNNSNVLIYIYFNHKNFIMNCEMIVKLLSDIIDKLDIGMTCIIHLQLILYNKELYNFIEQNFFKFDKATIFCPTYYGQESLNGYLILTNKLQNYKKQKLDVNHLYKYWIKIVNKLYKIKLIMHNVIDIYFIDPNMFYIIYNKYISKSYLNYM